MVTQFQGIRRDYEGATLRHRDLHSDPLVQLDQWLHEALEAGVEEPNAFVLSTASAAGDPSSRVLLLKALSPEGLTFFTNYKSRKGRDLEENPIASMNFYWPQQIRQVIVKGTVELLDREQTELYFAERPSSAQVAVWASQQGIPLLSREMLDYAYDRFQEEYEGESVPCPDYWGGYLLRPTFFEYWQGRPSRLHDRLAYVPHEDGWAITRLSP